MKNLVIAALLILSTATFAQETKENTQKKQRPTTEETVEKRMEKMKAELNLTNDQIAKIKPLLEEQVAKRKKMMAERKQAEDNRAAQRELMKADMKDLNDKMKDILTPEQYEKLKANRKEAVKTLREKRQERKAQG